MSLTVPPPATMGQQGRVVDTFGRPLQNLRVSVTDRCNLRCQYCMPEEEYVWLPRQDLLTFEEISELVECFAELGVDKVRITGGEPLLRRDLSTLVQMVVRIPRIHDVAITTNGVLLADHAQALWEAGLSRVTVSLDTLDPERFEVLTRRNGHEKVLRGIEAACEVGFKGLKIDSVVMRGYNDDELVPLLEYGKQVGAEVRFIEYMDVGGATRWSSDRVFPREAMLEVLRRYYGRVEPVIEVSSAPAERFTLPDGTAFGIIASMTVPFCRTCDRSRLTADGLWYLCLYAQEGIDLSRPLRSGASRAELKSIITGQWSARRDRGAEERKELEETQGFRGALVQIAELKQDPHREMHTRGG